jgi:hypothetical protein
MAKNVYFITHPNVLINRDVPVPHWPLSELGLERMRLCLRQPLLYCHLSGNEINRRWDQPPNGGGNYFRFSLAPRTVSDWWRKVD